MNTISKTLLFSLIPVITLFLGGLIALIKRPDGNIRSLILHFAAGVVFSVVAVEILPDILEEHMPVMTIIGFTLGFLTLIGVRKITETSSEKQVGMSVVPWSLVTGVGVDILIDGLLLGIGFAAGSAEGTLLAIALSVELLSLGMATAATLADNKVARKKSLLLIGALSGAFFISAVLGATLLRYVSPAVMDLVLSFGLAALLFLVTEELLTEAHEEKETTWHTAAFFGGFLLFMILGMYV